jgi:uncharacterized membrane protein/protein-disulfide isomerase
MGTDIKGEKTQFSLRFSVIIALLSLVGAVISFYTIYNHYRLTKAGGGISSCDINATFNCSAVELSEWSNIFGIPLGAYGVGFFLFLLFGTFTISKNKQLPLFFFLTLFSSLVSIILFLIAKLVIGAICPVCLVVYFINFTLFFIFYFNSRSARSESGTVKFLVGGLSNALKNSWLEMIVIAIISFSGAVIALPLAEELSLGEINSVKSELNKKVAEDTLLGAWLNGSEAEIPLNFSDSIKGDFIIGKQESRLQIVEFIDFLCPACQVSFFKLLELQQKNPDMFSIVVKNYPLDSECNSSIPSGGHEDACKLASLVRCLGEQGLFLEAAKLAFSNQLTSSINNGSFSDYAFNSLKQNLTFDLEKARECFKSGRQLEVVKREVVLGNKLKIEHTPTLFLNNRIIDSELMGSLDRLFAVASNYMEKSS